jgi:hypothetical protein
MVAIAELIINVMRNVSLVINSVPSYWVINLNICVEPKNMNVRIIVNIMIIVKINVKGNLTTKVIIYAKMIITVNKNVNIVPIIANLKVLKIIPSIYVNLTKNVNISVFYAIKNALIQDTIMMI